MKRQELILSCFDSVQDKTLSPLQIQKLMFLISKKIGEISIEEEFDFIPYDFGPFDKKIYSDIDLLIDDGYITILPGKVRQYKLVQNINNEVPHDLFEKIKELAQFVKSCSFKQLLTAIYKEYPETSVNAIYKDWGNQ